MLVMLFCYFDSFGPLLHYPVDFFCRSAPWNRLHGTIPSSLRLLTSLIVFQFNDNSFTGQIPSELPSGLEYLILHDNRLTGQIPGELGRLTGLQALYA